MNEYFKDIYEDYVYLQEDFDKYFDKTDKSLLAIKRVIQDEWCKAVNDIYTDCLFVFELFSNSSHEVLVANKSERFCNLTFGYKVVDKQSRYYLSYADDFIDLHKLIDVCIEETERYKLFENSLHKDFKFLFKRDDAFVCHFLYEQDLFMSNYTFTTVVQQLWINDVLLHAVVNVKHMICCIIVHVNSHSFVIDYSDYFDQVTAETDKNRNFYYLEQVDKDFTFYSNSDNWITPAETHKLLTETLYLDFSILERELQEELPPNNLAKSSVIKF